MGVIGDVYIGRGHNRDVGVSGVGGMWHGSIWDGGGWESEARDRWHHCLLHQVQGQQSAGRQVNTRGRFNFANRS